MFVIIAVLVGAAILAGGCLCYKAYYLSNLRYEVTPATAVVCGKCHSVPAPIAMPIGYSIENKIAYYEMKYNVYVVYEKNIFYINDKALYEQTNINDTVNVLVHKGYDKHNQCKNTYLTV